jgi:hypothetical protein
MRVHDALITCHGDAPEMLGSWVSKPKHVACRCRDDSFRGLYRDILLSIFYFYGPTPIVGVVQFRW